MTAYELSLIVYLMVAAGVYASLYFGIIREEDNPEPVDYAVAAGMAAVWLPFIVIVGFAMGVEEIIKRVKR